MNFNKFDKILFFKNLIIYELKKPRIKFTIFLNQRSNLWTWVIKWKTNLFKTIRVFKSLKIKMKFRIELIIKKEKRK